MTDSWATSESWVTVAERIGSDLHLELPGSGGRRTALIRALRDAVRTGRLPAGMRLPPYRSLAADLGLARNTVAGAYAELVAEGWLTARQGSGTRVAHLVDETPPARPRSPQPPPPLFDLRHGQPDAGSFPRQAWLAAARRALAAAPHNAFGPGDPRGRIELRTALAGYLARARGVRTSPEHIVICAGFAHALRLLFEDKVLPRSLAVESYGLPYHRSLLSRASVRTTPLPIDDDGAHTGVLRDHPGIATALLTPAHQFPTGGPLHPSRRAEAVEWARTTNALLLEDDYDGEFRYDRQPVGALQGLSPQHVLYVGSASKSLSPALRIGWMVVPDNLLDRVLDTKGQRETWSSTLDQLTLADLIASGAYDKHIRRMRQHYRQRRDHLVTALSEHAPQVHATGMAAGLHAVLRLPHGTEDKAHKATAARGLALDTLTSFRHPRASTPTPDGLVIGYGTPPDSTYRAAIHTLAVTLGTL